MTSLAVSGSCLASTSQDRFLRLHSTFPPPIQVGQSQEQKGEVLDKLYMKTVPTCVVADSSSTISTQGEAEGESEGDDEEAVWAGMEDADSNVDEDVGHKKRKTKDDGKQL